jgi:uncharacterized peroxidase-related enzyme
MAFIETIPQSEASGEVQAMYLHLQGKLDYLPNYAEVFCYRPGVMQAWADLQRAIRAQLDDRTFGLVTLASALTIGNSYCSLAHARKLSSRHFTVEELGAIIRDPQTSALPQRDKAMMAFAAKVAWDSSAVTQGDVDSLRGHCFTDAQIFDLVATAAARCFFGKVPDALGVQPDAALAEMDGTLVSLATVGRPIESEKTEISNQSLYAGFQELWAF